MRDGAAAPLVVIVNETMARYSFGNGDAIGRRFRWAQNDPNVFEIIGVVKDAKYNSLREQTPRLVYPSILQVGAPNFIQVRFGDRDAAAAAPEMREVLRGIDPAIPILNIALLSDGVERTLNFNRHSRAGGCLGERCACAARLAQ